METTKLLEDFRKSLKNKKFSEQTIWSYYITVRSFLNNFKDRKHPNEITAKEIEEYILSFPNTNTQISYYSPIKKFYGEVMENEEIFNEFKRPKRIEIERQSLDRKELLKKIGQVPNLKHEVILTITFSTGMRLSEVLNIRLEDINRKEMVLSIRNTKEEITRFCPLSPKVISLIDIYIHKYNPTKYLFNGQNSPKYNKKSCECMVTKWIGKDCSMTTIRNSTARALYQGGTDIKLIQRQLGLKSIKMTKKFLITFKEEKKIVLPI
jgi:integrase/recombinase XerD